MLPFLGPFDAFPPVESALPRQGGLLAVGGGLSPDRLLDAYRRGIFPWGTVEGNPVWYSPNPRMVLFPEQFRPSRSLEKKLRRSDYEIRFDSNFAQVLAACAAPRPGQEGTWITADMAEAYQRLHQLGWAHSIETHDREGLAGGLYGLSIGGVFFGESMFARRTDASKIAFAHLVRHLKENAFGLIDCQVHTAHLASLGAREISRTRFTALLAELIPSEATRQRGPWPTNVKA